MSHPSPPTLAPLRSHVLGSLSSLRLRRSLSPLRVSELSQPYSSVRPGHPPRLWTHQPGLQLHDQHHHPAQHPPEHLHRRHHSHHDHHGHCFKVRHLPSKQEKNVFILFRYRHYGVYKTGEEDDKEESILTDPIHVLDRESYVNLRYPTLTKD